MSGWLMSWPQIKKKKKSLFEVLFFYCMQQQTISWSDCDMQGKVDFTWKQQEAAQRLDQEEATRLFPKKVMVTVSWSVAGLIHHSFLNPGKTIASEKYAQQIDEMHQELQCLQPTLVNRMGPILLHDNAWPHVVHTANS